ncbi:Leucine-rich repeat-containing protein 4B [Folsomia candida]|uniref:Leucine-rich repeat-containing protein 4B n=1 Tax=Folsomia candida TaxID=158441 RepID=A0A226D018_FOLCA|nr:Leucine-rich repeat-containing protein 4B [Folsomia candida]
MSCLYPISTTPRSLRLPVLVSRVLLLARDDIPPGRKKSCPVSLLLAPSPPPQSSLLSLTLDFLSNRAAPLEEVLFRPRLLAGVMFHLRAKCDGKKSKIWTFSPGGFFIVGDVSDLNLGGNPIKRLKNGAFRFLPQLVKLDLSRCQVSDVEDQAFAHLAILETLKLNSNLLPILSNYTVKSLSQLHGVELHDNPWECDCRLRDLKLWIETKNIPHPISPTCHSPQRLSGRRFSELPVSEFACPPRIVWEGGGGGGVRQVGVVEGDNATFDCAFEAVPSPVVRWYLFGRPILNNTILSFSRKFIIFEENWKSSLVLTNTNLKDGGDFFCVVENSAGFVEANFSLEILPLPPYQNILDTSHIVVVVLAVVTILIMLAIGIGVFLWYRWRLAKQRAAQSYKGNGHGPPGGELLTPVKPPRISYDYEINSGSLVHQNGFKTHHAHHGKGGGGDSNTADNPDLILETNNTSNYQEHGGLGGEEESNNSELNWEQASLSYRNLGYATEYPTDYGLPIIHENSVYSDDTHSTAFYPLPPHPNGAIPHNVSLPLSNGCSSTVMSGVWNKNKVGARITAPNARDSPDEGYQEGYVGTDV